MLASTLTWLHLSDLQIQSPDYSKQASEISNQPNQEETLRALRADIRWRIEDSGLQPDLVLATGDTAFAGQPEEYRLALDFFDKLLGRNDLDTTRLFLIPGNHDIDQTDGSIGNYNAFVRDLFGDDLPSEPERQFHVRTLEVGGMQVAVLGANIVGTGSGAVQDDVSEVQMVLNQAAGADVKIALLHYPLNWYNSAGLLIENCDFILRSHHVRADEAPRVSHHDGNAAVIIGGSDYAADVHPNAYNFVRLDFATGTGTIYFRRYQVGSWGEDPRVYETGIDSFDLPSRLVLPERWSPPLAGYAADTATGPDRLNITDDVNAFASVFAAEGVIPPLCLGLFGDWGSGKSFFMETMEERIRFLAQRARQERANDRTTVYCSNIVQVKFNAWHYVDTNLWASLVCHIFDELAAFVDKEQKAINRVHLFRELETAKELLRQAKSDKESAKKAQKDAQEKLEELGRERETKSVDLRKLRAALFGRFLEQNPELGRNLKRASQQIGLSRTVESAEELQATLQEAQTLHGRLRATLLAMFYAPDRWWRIGLLVIVLLIIPLAPRIVDWFFRQVLRTPVLLDGVASALAQVTTFVLGVTSWLNGMLRKTAKAVTKLEDGQEQVAEFLQSSRKDPSQEERQLLQDLKELQDREVEANRVLSEAQQQFDRAQEEIRRIEEIDSGQHLAEFIQERIASEDYRKHLGIISLIRKDFESLSKMLKQQEPEPGASNASSSQDTKSATPLIDRIILYIDDLDRCPEDKVIQVLQAVHLLLAFELFIVVVGVDSRWLLRSLEKYYPALQATELEKTGLSDEEAWAWASTPQNYLEKIFQIPFNLRPMDSPGLERLVDSILPIESSGAPSPSVAGPVRESPDRSAGQPGEREVEQPGGPPGDQQAEEEGEAEPDRARVQRGERREDETDTFDPNPEALRVREIERDFIPRLSAMIPTPRAAKRFVNIYRLARASLSAQDEFVAGQEYKAAMVLLAILTGFPRQAPQVFRRILSLPDVYLWHSAIAELRPWRIEGSELEAYRNGLVPTMSAAEAVEWKRLHAALSDLQEMPETMAVYRQWARRVARFSFRVGKVVDGHSLSSDLRITHIEYDPPGDAVQGEYIRIENLGCTSQAMTGWIVSDIAGHRFAFPESFKLSPGGIVAVWTGKGTDTSTDLYWGRKAAVWNKRGDTAELRDASGRLISTYAYPRR